MKKIKIPLTWYSVGPACTESGVESFGGVGGKENKCWPLLNWWPPPPPPLPPPPPFPPPPLLDWIWLTLSCGSCGHTNELPHGLPDGFNLGSLSHGIGAWKVCGRHTCGDVCDVAIREAAMGEEEGTGTWLLAWTYPFCIAWVIMILLWIVIICKICRPFATK